MSGYFSPGDETRNALRNDRGSSTSLLLLVLVLVAAVAGYLYFFTDIIVPHKESVGTQPPPVQVKQPLPPRPGQPESAQAGPGTPAPPPAVTPPGQPAPTPAQPTVLPGQKQAPAPPQAKAAPAKAEQAKSPAKPAAPPAAKAAAPAAAPAPPKAVAAAPAGKRGPAQAAPGKKGEKAAGQQKGGHYRLLVGDFVPDKTLTSVLAKLKKCGITPVRKSVVTAPEPMHRLFVAQFADQDRADAELGRVKKITGDAFLVADNLGYSLYAGSYFSAGKAAAERKKLASRGVKSDIKTVKVAVRVTRVTAGSYASGAEAREEVARLKKQGIRATVVKTK